ncbi:Rqc2 family fibronectin-binding protein [Butyrivibrio sp. MC2013]|uniref:Rqc2 family fibronectin-binding protein n=1 Tax=Butyrivibrio sp. MC2013 TaxID=1280686 RepID=UPI0004284D89|nr:NFACT RNA binding domain-containing protein [Butyrivibrio sp. MC2013]
MAFDGFTVASLVSEIAASCVDGRINKIAQTEKDEIVLTIKRTIERGGGQIRLYLSADASLPLVYLSEENKVSPPQAPTFCMMLRKKLSGGRIISITQPSMERIIRIAVEHLDEMGDLRVITLLIELMGKYSNIIIIDEDNKIIDSIKHIPSSVSSVREVLPGRDYFVPDKQAKADPGETDKDRFMSLIGGSNAPVFKALCASFTGFASTMAHEICFRADQDPSVPGSQLTSDNLTRLYNVFELFMNRVKESAFTPTLYYENGKPAEYAAFPLQSYENGAEGSSRSFERMSDLLRFYYAEKSAITRIRQKSTDLRKIVSTSLERNIRKYDLQIKQLADTKKKDKYRLWGELLNAYGYSISQGAKTATVNNYNTGEDITIPLDPQLSPHENSVKYFDRYNKLKRTAENLEELTLQVKEEIDHLESIQNSLDIALTEADLLPIREELIECGYIHKRPAGGKEKKARDKSSPLHYLSSDGFDIYVGKNNYQNDMLTFKVANGGDWWFHAKGMPGSHVILRTGGNEVPDRAFEEAAALAGYYSKARDQEKAEIDYLKRKDVKKPGGAKPGFVVYYTNYSMAVKPDISSLKQLDE